MKEKERYKKVTLAKCAKCIYSQKKKNEELKCHDKGEISPYIKCSLVISCLSFKRVED